ncbi:MAG: peptidase S10 [Gammaproteobacteria bacterium]
MRRPASRGVSRAAQLSPFLAVLIALARVAMAQNSEMPPTHHTFGAGGARLEYDAMFDTFPVVSPADATVTATLTTIAYVRTDSIAVEAARPILFAFNGGPGAPSIYLNVGMLGPLRVELPADASTEGPGHYPLVANEHFILDVADLVLIDPAGTGFSRLGDDRGRDYFHSVTGDAETVAGVMNAWAVRHGRSGAPYYILGESYGATRAVEVIARLARKPEAISRLQGVVLLSQSLPIIDTVQRRSNAMGQAIGLPTIAASAWYHKLAGRNEEMERFVQQAEAFGTNEWLPALVAGRNLEGTRRRAVARRLSHFTGVPEKYLLEHDLYLSKDDFRRVALADRGLVLGSDDTRYTRAASAGRDPSAWLAAAMFESAPALFKEQFGIQGPIDYRNLAEIADWIYVRPPFETTGGGTYLQIDYVEHLQRVMAEKPDLRVFVAGGWFDTKASAGADEYLASRFGIDPRRVTARHYFGGHMFYTDPTARKQFARDLRAFLLARH